MDPSPNPTPPSSASPTIQAEQFLTFRLAEEEYAVDILAVQEIRGFSEVTPLPGTPPHVRGVMNLRGVIVPIVDLRRRFGLPSIEYTKLNVIVIMKVGVRAVGLLVDAVSDVVEIAAGQSELPPELSGDAAEFIKGVARLEDKLLIQVDVPKVVAIDELAS